MPYLHFQSFMLFRRWNAERKKVKDFKITRDLEYARYHSCGKESFLNERKPVTL